jgi:hypothetical protein
MPRAGQADVMAMWTRLTETVTCAPILSSFDRIALAHQRADRVLDQALVALITEAGREAVDDPHRPIGLRQQQGASVRRGRAAREIGHNAAALDPSESQRILSTLCRHRGASPLSQKSLSQNNFR